MTSHSRLRWPALREQHCPASSQASPSYAHLPCMTHPDRTLPEDVAASHDPEQDGQDARNAVGEGTARTHAPDKGKHRQREPELDTHLPGRAGPSRYSSRPARHRSLSSSRAMHSSSSALVTPMPSTPCPPSTPNMESSSSSPVSPPHRAPSASSTFRPSRSSRPHSPRLTATTTTTASSSVASSSCASTFMPAPSVPTSSDPSPSDSMAPTPASLSPLLRCPLCPSSDHLHSPVTLRCGHTLCTAHARPDARGRCPLPTCRSASPGPAVALHPESRVGYFAGAAGPAVPSVADRPRDGRTDVTVSKILELVDRAHAWLDEAERGDRVQPAPAYQSDEQTDSEAGDDDESAVPVCVDPEHDIEDMYLDPAPAAGTSTAAPTSSSMSSSLPGTSTAGRTHSPDQGLRTRRPRSRSPDATSRPRKRRRRFQHPPPPRRSPLEPTERDPAARFEKELLSELTCDICSQLFVQPVTAPCQHVSTFAFLRALGCTREAVQLYWWPRLLTLCGQTFCAGCLHRSLDYNMACPICRDGLEYTYFQEHPCNKLVLAISKNFKPENELSKLTVSRSTPDFPGGIRRAARRD